jgi:hypothetical protein
MYLSIYIYVFTQWKVGFNQQEWWIFSQIQALTSVIVHSIYAGYVYITVIMPKVSWDSEKSTYPGDTLKSSQPEIRT